MTAKQNRGPQKRRAPAVPLDFYDSQAGRRNPNLFFIFYNGEVTERNYFKGLGDALIPDEAIRTQYLRREYAHGSPQQVVEYAESAIAKRKNNDYQDIIWVVFDKDDFTNYSKVITLAHEKGMLAAYSNECFELWLLLHFQEQNTRIRRGRIAEILRCKWEEKSGKTVESDDDVKHFPYGIIHQHGDQDAAISRARDLYTSATEENAESPWNVNPVTTVHDLVESLKTFFNPLT